MNLDEIQLWADRRQSGERDEFHLIYELCEEVRKLERRVESLTVGVKPYTHNWLAEVPRHEIESFEARCLQDFNSRQQYATTLDEPQVL